MEDRLPKHLQLIGALVNGHLYENYNVRTWLQDDIFRIMKCRTVFSSGVECLKFSVQCF